MNSPRTFRLTAVLAVTAHLAGCSTPQQPKTAEQPPVSANHTSVDPDTGLEVTNVYNASAIRRK